MRAFPWLAATLLAGGLTSCSDTTGPVFRLGAGDLVLDIRDDIALGTLPSDPATITAAGMAGDILHLTVRITGCDGANHGFGLVAGTHFGASKPLFTALRLTHRAPAGPPCEKLVILRLRVDLSPIRPLVERAGDEHAVRIGLIEPGEHFADLGEIVYRWD